MLAYRQILQSARISDAVLWMIGNDGERHRQKDGKTKEIKTLYNLRNLITYIYIYIYIYIIYIYIYIYIYVISWLLLIQQRVAWLVCLIWIFWESGYQVAIEQPFRCGLLLGIFQHSTSHSWVIPIFSLSVFRIHVVHIYIERGRERERLQYLLITSAQNEHWNLHQ